MVRNSLRGPCSTHHILTYYNDNFDLEVLRFATQRKIFVPFFWRDSLYYQQAIFPKFHNWVCSDLNFTLSFVKTAIHIIFHRELQGMIAFEQALKQFQLRPITDSDRPRMRRIFHNVSALQTTTRRTC